MKPPEKLPSVGGRGKLSSTIARTWNKMNEIISFMESLQPKPNHKTRLFHTTSGWSIEPVRASGGDSEQSDCGPARYS